MPTEAGPKGFESWCDPKRSSHLGLGLGSGVRG